MTTIKTKNIDEAMTELEKKTCISFDGSNAGWGDAELFRIIQCFIGGCGYHLKKLNLSGNNFSLGAIKVLCAVIGPNAKQAITNALERNEQIKKSVNPQ